MEPVMLGELIISLTAEENGDLVVSSRVTGTLQYVTAMGMLEMAKETLDGLLNEDI